MICREPGMPGPVVYGKRQLAERQRAGRAPPLQVKGETIV